MFLRALIAFLVLPGLGGIILPATWLWFSGHTQVEQPFGLPILAAGIIGLLWCVRDFYVSGKGTLAPWSPPEKLVVVGLYRYSRNPMYLTAVLMLLGWAVSFNSMVLYIYTLVAAIAFHIRVVRAEEPWLASTHGEAWEHYRSQVPRWVGILRRTTGEQG